MARGYSTARSEQSDAMRRQASELLDKAAKIEAKEREDAAAKAAAESKAKAEAVVASGKPVTKEELDAAYDVYNKSNQRYMGTNLGYLGMKNNREAYEELKKRFDAQEQLAQAKQNEDRAKAEKKAEKIVKKGNDAGDKNTNEGPKAQKLALKVEKIASKASSAADKYFGAKDKKGVNAQKNKAKMKELVAKQAAAIPLEVRMAIQRLSSHNIGQDLVDAGVNALEYSKSKSKISGGEDYRNGRGDEGAFEYDSWSDLRYEAKRGGTDRKSGSVTHKGVTYKWETEESSNKIGWDPKQFAVHGKVSIKANNKTIFEGEEMNIEGG
jgi:colicin import membrane protein